jgi:hypothetical protein
MYTQVAPLVAAQGTGSQLPQGPMAGIPMFPATPMQSPATSFLMQLEQDVARATAQMHSTFPLPVVCAPRARAHNEGMTLVQMNAGRQPAPIFHRAMSAPPDIPTPSASSAAPAAPCAVASKTTRGPKRNHTRDKAASKEVVDAITKFHCRTVSGSATVWQGKFYSEFNVSSTHALTKYVLCKQCLLDKNFALARVSRGNGTAAHRTTTNARKHLHTHHKDLSERLLKMDGRVRVGEDAGMDMFVQPAPSHHKGPACQNSLDTLDAMVQMVSEELEPWDRLQSAPFKKFARSIHPHAWVPEVKTVQQHARAKVRSSACLHVF